MIARVPVYARKRQRWTNARETLKNGYSTRRSADGKYTGTVVIARDLGRRTTVGESGESSVNSIRIALVYIRGQDSPRAILHRECRRADIYRSVC